MSTEQETFDNNSFDEKPVYKFLDGKHHFIIPSYQRGYRWDTKQVTDMLKDLCQFANDGNPNNNKYFLQPIVVKNTSEGWEVLDGQQRLTTMLLILKVFLNGEYMMPAETKHFIPLLYTLTYRTRPELDFDNPDYLENIDSYYLSNAKKVIENWMHDKIESNNAKALNEIKNCLFSGGENIKQVYFIWYPVPETRDDESSIKVFNRLNKGKIALTGSELIKALFIQDCNRQKTDGNTIEAKQHEEQLSMEWAEMERKFQDDKFWYFLSNTEEQTRIDLLFDFVTGKKIEDDSDFSYRMFQNLYDFNLNPQNTDLEQIWKDKKKQINKNTYTMDDAWKAVKETFSRLLSWYESNLYYHYIGFLITQNRLPLEIFNKLETEKEKAKAKWKEFGTKKEWTEDDTKDYFRLMIRDEFTEENKRKEKDDIDGLEYDSRLTRRLLLLFNIETCIRTENQRFEFDKFKKEKWDVEHISAQNDATLQEFDERMKWLEIIRKCLKTEIRAKAPYSKEAIPLEKKCSELIQSFNENHRVNQQEYSDFYGQVNAHFDSGDSSDTNKNNISNLTLLNSSTNREYKDAPFMHKREVIISKDKEGKCFLPICTRNCFLKYYTEADNDISQLDAMRWNKTDKSNYLAAIHEVLDPIFTTVEKKDNNND